VAAFLAERLPFVGIPETIAAVMDTHRVRAVARLDDVLEADAWARQETGRRIGAGAAAAR
jgi:1-deoxy-D-xylulose-5-phosphate reductoisomerase